jgi:ABC-2 type transport system ATP-binding protein
VTAPAAELLDVVRVFSRRGGAPVRALDGVSLRVEEREVHGLLGPNGAGKTTLVKILSTALVPTSGRATLCGHDVVAEAKAVRPLIGIVFGGERGLYGRLTGRQNLEYWAALYRLPPKQLRRRAQELLERVGLAERADARVETYSRGMKQRLHLARGLVGDARVLFLDEPTAGMDPAAAREFRTLVDEFRREGRTVLLATHDMAEAEALCDRVTLIDHGRVLASESPRTLSRILGHLHRIEADDVPEVLAERVRATRGVSHVGTADGTLHVDVEGEEAALAVLKLLVDHGVAAIRKSAPSLEEVYLRLVGDRGLAV